MTKTMMSFRLPSDTPERLKALAQQGESQAAVFLRALAVLEGQAASGSTEPQPHDDRLAVIEQRLDVLEAGLAPADDGVADYPLIVKEGAVRMQATGKAPAEIRKAIEQACGRSPDPKHLARTLRRWASQIGAGAENNRGDQ